MKKLYTLLLLLFSADLFAAAPTVPASNLVFNAIDGGFFNIGWTAGNGTRRVIICKAGSAVTFRPQNGVDYAENTRFGQGQQVAPGEYVVYDNAFTSFFLENLTPGTQYFLAIFEYNGQGVTSEYLTTSFLQGSGFTSGVPSLQASAANFTNITTNSATVSWTSGDGQRCLVVVREGSPVNADPANSTPYVANAAFGSGAVVAPGNFSVYNSSGNFVNITNLKQGTQYHLAFFEFNGSSQPQYKKPAYTTTVTTRSVPTTAASNVVISKVDGKELTLNWTNGNGQRRIIVAKQGSNVTGTPANGTDYAANPVFGTGPTIAAGEYVVYDDNFNAATISGLNPNTSYFFKIFEYDGTGATTAYLTSSFGAANGTTATTPGTQTASVNATNITAVSLSLNWTSGNGRARLVIGRKDQPVSAVPTEFTPYTSGQDLGNGNFVIGNSTDAFIGVGSLQPNSTYHFAVYEFNGFNQPLYLSNPARFNVTTAVSLPVKLIQWEAIAASDKVKLQWSTSSEMSSKQFIVERSGDGLHYNSIATVAAAGNSQARINYAVDDRSPLSGKSFYRLKMIDIDGEYEYSAVRLVQLSAKQSVLLVSNPVRQNLELVVSANEAKEWQIVNANGQLVHKGRAVVGRNEINVSNLGAGSYWLRVNMGDKVEVLRFVKL